MRVGRYIVTSEDYVGPDGRQKILRICPSEDLPKQRVRKERADELRLLLRQLELEEAKNERS